MRQELNLLEGRHKTDGDLFCHGPAGQREERRLGYVHYSRLPAGNSANRRDSERSKTAWSRDGARGRGVVIFHVNGTEVAVLLRTRVGFEEKVTIETGADTTQLPPLSTYPALQAVQEPAAPLPFGQVGAQLPPMSTYPALHEVQEEPAMPEPLEQVG